MTRNKLYILMITACLAGYVWLAIANLNSVKSENSDFGICLIKHVTNIPCPSCGSTRSILAFVKGNFSDSLLLNPFGILILLIMIISPIWILYDTFTCSETFFKFYNKTEIVLKQKWISIPVILLVLGNWLWNIYKGL